MRIAIPQVPVDASVALEFDRAALQGRSSEQRLVRDEVLGAAHRTDDHARVRALGRRLGFRPVGLVGCRRFYRGDLYPLLEMPKPVIEIFCDVFGAVLVARDVSAECVSVGVIAEQDNDGAMLINPVWLDLAPVDPVLPIVVGLYHGHSFFYVAIIVFDFEELQTVPPDVSSRMMRIMAAWPPDQEITTTP